ncbi:hypothetical protein EMCLV024L [Equine molluscum contagiosum-like virus]|nr:hypothetical protein EMCLV024L [Equine molluscum contagiosum-like virus]
MPRAAQQCLVLAKPYLTVYLDPAPVFPVVMPVQGNVLKCVDVPASAVEKCAAFVEMHRPRAADSMCGARDLSTARYTIRATTGCVADAAAPATLTRAAPARADELSYVTVDKRCAEVRTLALAIHHTSRELLFPTPAQPEARAGYHAVLVYEGDAGLYEHAVLHFGLQDGARARTLSAPVSTVTARDGDAVSHVESRAVLTLDVGESTVAFKNPHIITIRVEQKPGAAPRCFSAFKYG